MKRVLVDLSNDLSVCMVGVYYGFTDGVVDVQFRLQPTVGKIYTENPDENRCFGIQFHEHELAEDVPLFEAAIARSPDEIIAHIRAEWAKWKDPDPAVKSGVRGEYHELFGYVEEVGTAP